MKKYETAEMEIIHLDPNDIVTDSFCPEETERL